MIMEKISYLFLIVAQYVIYFTSELSWAKLYVMGVLACGFIILTIYAFPFKIAEKTGSTEEAKHGK